MSANNNSNLINNTARLAWACRRGMLELDVLLGNFLKEAYPSLDLPEKQAFVNLLTLEDPVLFACLMGHEQPDQENALIVNKIRHHVQTRF